MGTFQVMTRGKDPASVEGENWLVALGRGLVALGESADIARLACERLPNGTIIARDATSGRGWVVQAVVEAFDDEATDPGGGIVSIDIEDDEDEPSAMDMPSVSLSVEDLIERTEAEATPAGEQTLTFLEGVETLAYLSSPAMAWAHGLALAMQMAGSVAGSAVEIRDEGLFFVAVEGDQASKLHGVRLPEGTGFVGFCIDRAMAFTVNDVNRDGRHYGAVDRATGFATRAVMCVPVVGEGRVFGCIQLLNPPVRFTREHQEQVELIAAALAENLFRAAVTGRRLG